MQPAKLETDLLRTFLAIVDEGSFRRAADRLGRTQSAVSMQMQRLEDAVGHRLLTRERPAVRPTTKGEALTVYARRIVRLQHEAWTMLADAPTVGRVRFGIPDDYALRILPRILEHFVAEHPLVEVEVRCETSLALVGQLAAGGLDLAVITRTAGRPRGDLLRREPVVWATSPRHQVHEATPLPLAVFQPECNMRELTAAALDDAGRRHRIAFSSPNLAALLAVTGAGLAVAAVPLSSVPDGLRVLGTADGFPELPELELAVLRGAAADASTADALAMSAHSAVGIAGPLP